MGFLGQFRGRRVCRICYAREGLFFEVMGFLGHFSVSRSIGSDILANQGWIWDTRAPKCYTLPRNLEQIKMPSDAKNLSIRPTALIRAAEKAFPGRPWRWTPGEASSELHTPGGGPAPRLAIARRLSLSKSDAYWQISAESEYRSCCVDSRAADIDVEVFITCLKQCLAFVRGFDLLTDIKVAIPWIDWEVMQVNSQQVIQSRNYDRLMHPDNPMAIGNCFMPTPGILSNYTRRMDFTPLPAVRIFPHYSEAGWSYRAIETAEEGVTWLEVLAGVERLMGEVSGYRPGCAPTICQDRLQASKQEAPA